MLPLREDIPELADKILSAARSNPTLLEILTDYDSACSGMCDRRARPEDRAQWAQIRAELVLELEREYRRTQSA